MPSVDTNVLVRYIVRDDVGQLRQAEEFVSRYFDRPESLFVPLTVALELEWVLRTAYGVAKTVVLETFSHLLESRELWFQEESTLEKALHLYRMGNADFADCLHVASAHTYNEQPLVTFDRKAARLPHAQHISEI